MVTADEELPRGAIAPTGRRVIRSRSMLDLVWLLVVAGAILISSRLPLLGTGDSSVSSSDAPLRVYSLGIPIVAIIGGLAGARSGRSSVLAAALGVVAPAVALIGSLGASLFFDRASAFAGGGAPASLLAGAVGAVALARWFVYRGPVVVQDEMRPVVGTSRALVVLGVIAMVVVVVTAVSDRGAWSIASTVQVVFALVVPTVVVCAGVVRNRSAFVLAAGAAVSQCIGVVVARVESPPVQIDSDLALWTGIVGIVVLLAAAITAVIGSSRLAVDAPVTVVDDDISWRWESNEP